MIEALPIQQKNGHRSLLLINKSAEYTKVNLTENYGSFEVGKTQINSLNADGIKVFNPQAKTNLKTFSLSPYSVLLLRSLVPIDSVVG